MIYASNQPIPFQEKPPDAGLESRLDACRPLSGFHQRRNPRCQKIWGLLRTSDEHFRGAAKNFLLRTSCLQFQSHFANLSNLPQVVLLWLVNLL
jgi:hypothetical protein